MKKIKVVLCCIILCMNLGGCGKPMSRGKQLARELGSEQQLADRMMEEIVAALDNGDVEAYQYEVVDKHNPDREGLLSMEIVTDATYQKRDFRWQYADNPGVFLQR